MQTFSLRDQIHELVTLLPSYFNFYQAIQYRLKFHKFSVIELAEGSDLSKCVVRLRKQKPELWTLQEIRQIAEAMNLSTGSCDRLEAGLNRLGDLLLEKPDRSLVELINVCGLQKQRYRRREGERWSYEALLMLYRGASNWFASQPKCSKSSLYVNAK